MYVNDPPPRVPMSYRLSVKESGVVHQAALDQGVKATWDSGARVSVLSIEKCFGGHPVFETQIVSADDPAEKWLAAMETINTQIAKRMRSMQAEVTPQIAALLNVADCDCEFSAGHDAWFVRWGDDGRRNRGRAIKIGEKYSRALPIDADYDTWRIAITSIADELAVDKQSKVERAQRHTDEQPENQTSEPRVGTDDAQQDLFSGVPTAATSADSASAPAERDPTLPDTSVFAGAPPAAPVAEDQFEQPPPDAHGGESTPEIPEVNEYLTVAEINASMKPAVTAPTTIERLDVQNLKHLHDATVGGNVRPTLSLKKP